MQQLPLFVLFVPLFLLAQAHAQTKRIAAAYSAISATQAGFYLTKDAKLFEKHGFYVDPVYVASGTKVAQAVVETVLAQIGEKDAKAREAKPEDFIDLTFYNEMEKSGFFKSLARWRADSRIRIILPQRRKARKVSASIFPNVAPWREINPAPHDVYSTQDVMLNSR